jgi:hypothetical protein
MPWTSLTLIIGCAFVEPPVEPVELDPPQAILDRIDAQRQRLQGTDAGAELWRSIDIHGGLLRYERVGPWTAHLADGRAIGPDDPLHAQLTRPFSWANTPMSTEAPGRNGTVLRTTDGTRINLDPVDRHVVSWSSDAGMHEVSATRSVQGLELIAELVLPDGRRLVVARWEAADPLPGWPVDKG